MINPVNSPPDHITVTWFSYVINSDAYNSSYAGVSTHILCTRIGSSYLKSIKKRKKRVQSVLYRHFRIREYKMFLLIMRIARDSPTHRSLNWHNTLTTKF